jgi:hypothetical protein
VDFGTLLARGADYLRKNMGLLSPMLHGRSAGVWRGGQRVSLVFAVFVVHLSSSGDAGAARIRGKMGGA